MNKRKSVDICGYKLPINVQNCMQKDSAQAKISLKVIGGLIFLLTFYIFIYTAHIIKKTSNALVTLVEKERD